MRAFLTICGLLISLLCFSQIRNATGIIMGNVLDSGSKALKGATIELISRSDSSTVSRALTDENGGFDIENIPFGYYRLHISYTGFQTLSIDSIWFRQERFDFNMNDIVLKQAAGAKNLDEIIIYAEKPLIQSKDGNIIFNAGESALSESSNASDLLTTVPLVSKDPDGKIVVRGKEPKILIDDKPVELNAQQLQDLLESMPGNSIERIEVMTNPPAQYAMEQGGVINIVTKKGSVGKNGRITVYGGTRGDYGLNGSFNYRKKGLSLNINAGAGYSYVKGGGYSGRQNLYKDSTNFFNTASSYRNTAIRPNARINLNYDINKNHSLNLTLQYSQNHFDNTSNTSYTNINRMGDVYRLSSRDIRSKGTGYNPNLSFNYGLRTKRIGEFLRIIGNLYYASSGNIRDFYQQFLYADYTPITGRDSTQNQDNNTPGLGYSLRLNYDRPVGKSTSVSAGGYYNYSLSDVDVNAFYKRRVDGVYTPLDGLTNNFKFHQAITNFRASIRQRLGEGVSLSAGVAAEQTAIRFDLTKGAADTANHYRSLLPFATLNRTWANNTNLTFTYRKSIRRPGIGQLNPTIDLSDPYNLRFGNPGLIASTAHNFDLILGKTKGSRFYVNVGLGYNIVDNIFTQVKTLIAEGKTQTTFENISGRKEHEVSTWSGYSFTKNIKASLSGSYSYNTYSEFDRKVRLYRNGGSFTSNLSTNYTLKNLYTATASINFNRFANPQGTVRSAVGMNLGLQARLMRKRIIASVNFIDPFTQQKNRVFTYAPNFIQESYTAARTQNIRFSVGYNFTRLPPKKKGAQINKSQLLKKVKGPLSPGGGN